MHVLLAPAATWQEAKQNEPWATGGGPHVTRSQLLQQVVQFAGVLKASGIRPGDTVSLADTNTVSAKDSVKAAESQMLCCRMQPCLLCQIVECARHGMQVEFVVAFLGITWARAVAAPLNSNYKQVRTQA
jgi:acyl-CoA synthetase (AMP-forming)/AMP-acid ligase II